MIVNPVPEGWEVIFQRAHELLALQLASYWLPEKRPARWMEVLSAISDHDNQQEPWHGRSHLSKAGAPLDFSMKPFSLQQARAVCQTAQYKSRTVSLLISMHISYLYEPLRGQQKELDAFLDEQLGQQKSWRKALKLSKEEAQRAYHLVQWADRCSLILCRNELPADERKLEIFQGPEEETYTLFQRRDESVGVEPWCFSEDEFRVYVESRTLKQLGFSSDEELAEALRQAAIVEKSWTFRRE